MSPFAQLLCVYGILSSPLVSYVSARLIPEGIIGGDYASQGDYPYMVSVQAFGGHMCGGAIIADQYVLTAAHCIIDNNNQFTNWPYKVVANSVDLKTNPGIQVDVVTGYVYKDYQPPKNYFYDIAVLKLKHGIGLGKNPALKKVNLPTFGKSYAGESAVISGFGLIDVKMKFELHTWQRIEDGGYTDQKLKFTDVHIISNVECQKLYPPSHVSSTHICGKAVQRGRALHEGVCSGDSGSPLVIDNTVVGVVSASPYGCDESQFPAKYTRVSSFLPFIQNVLRGQVGSDVRTYTMPSQ